MPRPRFTKTYAREAPWQGDTDPELRELMLQLLEQQRHAVVGDIRADGTGAGAGFYEWGRQVLGDLPDLDNPEMRADARFPGLDTYLQMPPEAAARAMQRLLTELSDQLDPVVIPPPNGGGGGGGGDGQGQGDEQDGEGKPQSGEGKDQQGQQGQQQQPGQQPGRQPGARPKGNPAPPKKAKPNKPGQGPGQGQGQQAGKQQAKPAPGALAPAGGARPYETDSTGTRSVEEPPPPKPENTVAGGGGEQFMGKTKDGAIFYAMRDLITKIALDTDFASTLRDGSERWNVGRVYRSRFNVTFLRNAKDDHATTVDEMYISLDTSGSVNKYTREIAGMAAGAAGLVHLFHGTEGRPQYVIPRKEPLKYPGQPFPEWDSGGERLRHRAGYNTFAVDFLARHQPYHSHLGAGSFETDLAWMLHLYKPSKGSYLIFWGDTEGVGFHAPYLLRQLVRPYRFVWLYCYEESHAWDYYGARAQQAWGDRGGMMRAMLARPGAHGIEYPILTGVGLPVFHNIRSAASIRGAFQRIQTIRGGVA